MSRRAPDPDQFEVSVFGPGYGEAIALHLGEGDWLLADSCLDQRSGNHPVLRYFDRIGIDPSTQVKAIVISHWHRDHVRGLAQLVTASPSAEVFFSDALLEDELLALAMGGANSLTSQSPLRELAETIEILKARAVGGGLLPLRHASAGMMVYRGRGAIPTSVQAIAPSGADVLATKMSLSGLVRSKAIWKMHKRHPNDTSVALWLEFGNVRALLGADLEHRSDVNRGWNAVVHHHSRHLSGSATIVKVPHHGSITGHNDGMWTSMVAASSHGLAAPFRPSKLPRDSDIARLLHLTTRLHLTAKVDEPKIPTIPELRGHAIEVAEPEGRAGQIQIRGGQSDDPSAFSVYWFPPAYEVTTAS